MLKKLDIRHVEDLLDQIDPFFYYLASKYLENKGNNAYEAFCQVDFCFGNPPNTNYVYSNVKQFYTRECFDENISFLEKYSQNTRTFFESHSIFGEPFQIRICLHADYIEMAQGIDEQDEEEEDEDEEEEEKEEEPLKPLKTDHCVICMENPPNIFFYNCMHICTCSNCEVNTLNRCPYCRAIAIEKICIKKLFLRKKLQ